MGRRRQAYKLEKRGNGIWYVVGTTPDGRRPHRSTRTRSRKAAAQRLPLIVEQEEAGGRATFSEVVDTPLEELLAAWLTSAASEVASAQGDGSLFETYARHFLRFLQTTARICDEVAIEQYKEYRLGQVQATTLRGELSALRRLHRWMKKRKLLSALPEVPKVPKRATGTAHKLGKRKVVANLEEAQAVLFPTSFFTSPGEATPTTAEQIAEAAEMIGCGREDSNLHECYLTRSLV